MITNTNTLDKYQVKKLLEHNRVSIIKDQGTHYQITGSVAKFSKG